MELKDQLKQEKPCAVLGWTRKQWKQSKMWKKAGVTEKKRTRFLLCLDHETVQELKDHAIADVLISITCLEKESKQDI